MKKFSILLGLIVFSSLRPALLRAQESAQDLAKKLANPVSSLISLPFQNNSDYGIGRFKGSRNTMNIQPVVPIGITKDLNLIARWVQPIVTQYNITAPGAKQSGLTDAVVSALTLLHRIAVRLAWGGAPWPHCCSLRNSLLV